MLLPGILYIFKKSKKGKCSCLRLMLQHDFKTFEDMCNRALAKSQITVSEYDDLINKAYKYDKHYD